MPLNLSPTQIAFNPRGQGKFNKPFKQQLRFFRQKLNLPTEKYDDILRSAHDKAFVVAGAAKADLLTDLRVSIDTAIAEGKSIGWFRKNFDSIVKKNGWEGWTGSHSKSGRDWRTRVIYRTNIASSYAAGRYQQLTDPDLLKSRPYWRYVHNDTVSQPRRLHVEWSGTVLKADDPWWSSHFPPNGWGCRCRVVAVSTREFKGAKAPDNGTYTRDDRYGVRHSIPKGIDYGWDYAPGASIDLSLRNLVQDKMIRYPEAIARALSRDINQQVAVSKNIVDFAENALSNPDKALFFAGFVESFARIDAVLKAEKSLKGYTVFLSSSAVRHANKSHGFDGGKQRPVVADDYLLLTTILSDPDRILKGKATKNGNQTVEIWKRINGENYRAVFEVFSGKKRNIRLLSFLIKTR